MLPVPLPLPFNPLNPLGVVSNTVATAATLAGLGAGVLLGAALLAAGSMMARR